MKIGFFDDYIARRDSGRHDRRRLLGRRRNPAPRSHDLINGLIAGY